MSNVDANSVAPAMGVTDDANLTPTQLKVDPVTGYLIVINVGGTVGGTVNTALRTDANDNPVGMAVSETDASVIRPLLTTTEGYLLVSN